MSYISITFRHATLTDRDSSTALAEITITTLPISIINVFISNIINTSGQSILRTGRIAAAHGRFSGIRQVAPVCTRANTCFLGPTQVQVSNDISISSVVHLNTVSPYFTTGRPFPLPIKLPFP